MRGAPAPGRGRHLQLPGRGDPAAVRHPRRLPGAAPRPGPPRAGRRPRGRRLRTGDRARRGVHGHVGAGRDQPGHGHRHRAAQFGADGGHHRQRAGGADRQGRLPGDRHQRHHAADDQAQLPGPRRGRPAAGRRRGVPHRAVRAPRAGPHRHHQGRPPAGDAGDPPVRGRGRGRPARLPAEHGRSPAPAQVGRGRDRRCQAPGHPGRSRGPPRRGLGRPGRVRGEDPDPGRLDAARDRGDRRDPPAGLWLHGDARLEARQPGHPERRPARRHRDALR